MATKKRHAETPLTLFGLTQQLEPEHWTWATTPEAAAVLQQGADAILTELVRRLEAGGCEVDAAYGIVHDQDEREVWSEVAQKLQPESKPSHIHVVIAFTDRKHGATLTRIAQLLGVEPQYVEKPGRGGHAFDNMLAYLVHVKYFEKHQYRPEAVATVRGRDYVAIAHERWADWLRGRATVGRKKAVEGVDDLEARILAGEVSLQQVLLTDDLYRVYATARVRLDTAFQTAAMRRMAQSAASMQAGRFSTSVVYICGPAGAGKSRTADAIAARVLDVVAQTTGGQWHVYRAATAHPMDDYMGQEVVILDDLRQGAMTANELLLLLDPYRASPAAARYRNKAAVAPRLILITTVSAPLAFWKYMPRKGAEPYDQILRRLHMVLMASGATVTTVQVVGATAQEYFVRDKDRWGESKVCLHYAPAWEVVASADMVPDVVAATAAARWPDMPALLSPSDAFARRLPWQRPMLPQKIE